MPVENLPNVESIFTPTVQALALSVLALALILLSFRLHEHAKRARPWAYRTQPDEGPAIFFLFVLATSIAAWYFSQT